MNRGYIRLWRKFLDGGYVKNHGLCAFMVWCLLKANHEDDYETIVGLQRVILNPGEFIFGRIKAAEETGLSEQEIRTIIAFLKKIEFLTIKPTNKFSVISIINWPIYQAVYEVNQPANQPTTNQQLTTNKNNRTKEINIKKRKSPIPDDFKISDRVKIWAEKKKLNRLDEHLEHFILCCSAKGYEYVDWDAALMNAITNNWAKLDGTKKKSDPFKA